MKHFKLGIMHDCLRLPFEDSIKKVAEIGADGVQIGIAPWSPPSAEDVRKTLEILRRYNIGVSAVCCELGGFVHEPEKNAEKVEWVKRAMDYACALGTNTVSGHIGVIPDDKNHPDYRLCLEALGPVAEYGRSVGVTYAAETGPETCPVLLPFLQDLGGGVGVNFDPANLTMGFEDDVVAGVHILKDYIVHTHAKDGIRIHRDDGGYPGLEVPLGEGKVPFPQWMGALKDIGYTGYLTIEREVGDDPVSDIVKAAEFLRKIDASL